MATLVLNAPTWREREPDARSFEQILESGVCGGYAIPATLHSRIHPGCTVVLLNKDKQKRAEGTLVRLQSADKTKSGIQRYDVHVRDFRIVPYQPEALGRTGVAVI
jgi:hypothetical protein